LIFVSEQFFLFSHLSIKSTPKSQKKENATIPKVFGTKNIKIHKEQSINNLDLVNSLILWVFVAKITFRSGLSIKSFSRLSIFH